MTQYHTVDSNLDHKSHARMLLVQLLLQLEALTAKLLDEEQLVHPASGSPSPRRPCLAGKWLPMVICRVSL